MSYSKSIINPYNELLKKIVREGCDTPYTRMLMDQQITFDLRPLNIDCQTDWNLMMPLQRGSITSSMKYAAAEAVWYLAHTRKIDLIAKYGKIWCQMTDDQGLINSNYGYQLLHNQNVDDRIEELYETGKTVLNIISTDNQDSTNDLVCNNQIVLSLGSEFDGHHELSAKVTARSIDVMFGLPYDMFAAQGLMAVVADVLHQKYSIDPAFDKLQFKISNVHWYHRQNPSEEQLKQLSTHALIVPYKRTPYAQFADDHSDRTDDKYRDLIHEYRQEMVDDSMDIRLVSDRDLSESVVDGNDILLQTDTLEEMDKVISECRENEFIPFKASIYANDDMMLIDEEERLAEHWKNIIKPRLAEDQFDRKAVFFDEKTNEIYYVVYYQDKFSLLRFEPVTVNGDE